MPTQPVIFLKPPSALIDSTQSIRIPFGCSNLHHEVELGVVIGETASQVSAKHAEDVIRGYCLCLDMTARDFQDTAKEQRLPWALAKGFDTSCPVSDIIDRQSIANIADINLELTINGEVRQSGNTADMIFSEPELIEFCSRYFTLNPGDLILTGTPDGVSRVDKGDILVSKLWTRDGAGRAVSLEMTNSVV